jgi:hypothetical protein
LYSVFIFLHINTPTRNFRLTPEINPPREAGLA